MGTCASDCVFYDPELDRERRKFEAKRLRYQMAKHAEQNRASQTLGQALETLRVRGRSPGSPDATPVDEHRRLWLSDVHSALDSRWLSNHGVGHIVNATKWSYAAENREMLRVAIDDDEGENISRFLEPASDFIDKALGQGASVLVHCEFGISRSATIVVAQQMRKFGLSAATALTRVHDQRPIVSPNRAFLEALLDWEVRCAPNRDAAAPKLDHAAALAELRGIVEFEGEGGCC